VNEGRHGERLAMMNEAGMSETGEQHDARPPGLVGRYSNVFRVGFNAFEVVVEFGEQFSDDEHPSMHTRMITNPVFARGLVDSLNEALANYDRMYPAEPKG
jgi:hypothetical protein